MDNPLNNFSNTKLEYVLIGDLNCDLLKNRMDNHTKHFVYTCETHQLTQIIDKPTRITPNSRSLIDMIMTTNFEKIVEHNLKSVGSADNYLIYHVTSYKSQLSAQSHRTIEMRNFKNFDVDDFLLDLEQSDWSSINGF